MWILMMNDMRSRNVEDLHEVVKSETREKLEDFIKSELVDLYRENGWHKSFRKGGPLEWYNPPTDDDEAFRTVMPLEDIIKAATEHYHKKLDSIPTI
jgi:hypothetical protein